MNNQVLKIYNFHILIVDDDQKIRLLLKQFLENNGFRVSDAENTDQAKKIMESLIFDLLVIDIMMPGQNGLDFLKEIRLTNSIPTLMLTAMSSPEDRLDGLEYGADDYMTKPFEPRELLLRIQNILKRFTKNLKSSVEKENTRFGPFTFNKKSQNLYKNDIPVHLTTSEQKLLKCFCKSPNTPFSREDINNSLGGNMETRSIDVAIARIRRKIEIDQRYPIYLQTVRGIGWMLQTHEDNNDENYNNTMRLRDITPKSLFGRMLSIILVPIILVQIISVSIFYERHWDWVSRHMANNLAKDLGLLIDELGNEPSKDQRALSAVRARQYFNIIFYWLEGGILKPNQSFNAKFENFRISLQERIKEPFYLSSLENSSQFYVDIQLANGIVRMHIDNKRIFVPTGITFIMWSIGSSVILFSIAIIFLRGQVRPILRLANAARQIGFGRKVDHYNIEGATEVRIAGRAFQAMRHRINKQISERTSLLAGVSHDLKTPLTRMRLQLAVMDEKKEIKEDFEKELIELEEMIDGYLEFARNEREEQMVDASLFKLLQQAAKTSDPSGEKITISVPTDNIPVFPIQVQSIRRALINLFTNAIRYAGKANAQIQIFDDHSEIIIDDNGPGIPRDKRDQVILPFTRLENSRNFKTGGTGLGLSIAKNSALNHGGELILEDSPLGGLRVRLLLPL